MGGKAEFEQIYRAYFDDVFYFVLKLSGSKSIAEEITSETFFKALKAIDSFRGDCHIRVWLCQIAKNCWYSYLKKHGGQTMPEGPALPQGENSIEEQLADWSDAEDLRLLVHSLPDPYKEVFMWRVFGEMSFRQIGGIFGKTENWACVTYHRAKAMIQKQMKEE